MLEEEVSHVSVDEDGWETLDLPDDSSTDEEEEVEFVELQPISDDDERAALEAELARIDASWEHRSEPSVVKSNALENLESKLSDLDL